jgi:hypothetical protein
MLDRAKQMYRDAQAAHRKLYEQVVSLREEIKTLNLAELTDLAYAMREAVELLDDTKKALNEIQRMAEKYATLNWMQESQVLGEQFRIKTEYCSAEPKIKQFPKFPQKRRIDPDKFDKLMAGIGVPQELIESEALRPNWEGFTNWFSHRQSQGLPVPDGIDPTETYTEYTLAIRKIKDVMEE